MKKILLLLLTIFSLNVFSQYSNDWNTDINKAIKTSIKEDKPMLLFFTGSDWCGWCKKLVREVYKTPEFSKWAQKNVVLVDIDFPKRTTLPKELQQQNRTLGQLFAVRGYPTVWLVELTNKGGDNVVRYNNYYLKALGKTGYVAGGPNNWINGANQFLKNK